MSTLYPVQTTVDNGIIIEPSQIASLTGVEVYVNGSTGSDANSGSISDPLATLAAAEVAVPPEWRRWARIIMDADGIPRTYVSSGTTRRAQGQVGPYATPLVYIGAKRTLVPAQANTIAGSASVLTGAIPNTTVTDNPLTSGATAINVASTAGLPTSGIVQIDNEIILYTGVTPTSLTGCTRGFCLTTAASHVLGASVVLFLAGYWVTITSGAQAGQRRQIKTNTATNLTLNVNATGNFDLTTNFIVEGAGTQINHTAWYPQWSTFALKDVILNALDGSGFFSTQQSTAFLQGVDIRMNGFNQAVQGQVSMSPGNIASAFAADGVSFPFTAAHDPAGVRYQGSGSSVVIVGRSSTLNGTITHVNARLLFDTASSSRSLNATMHGSPLLLSEGAACRMDSSPTNNRYLFNFSQITVDNNSELRLSVADANNVTGSAIRVANGSFAVLTNIIGTGNTRYGVEVVEGDVRMADALSTVTGILGDIKVGARPVRQWSDFNSLTPPSTLPSKSDFDVPGFAARPFKLAFAGLTAADTFDITTLAPFATPVGASRGLVAASSVGGSFAIAGVIVTFTAPAPAVGTAFSAADVGTRITHAGSTSAGNNGTFTLLTAAGNVCTYTNAAGVTEAAIGTYAFTATSSIWANTPPIIANASTLRVVAGAAAFLGTYMLVDTGGTPLGTVAGTVVGVATLSDDGKTVTFPAGTLATAFTIEYLPIAGVLVANTMTGARMWQV
jgi:hypothetical protein